MNILFWGLTLGLIGKVLLAVGVLFVHGKIVEEHKIDRTVERSFRVEFIATLIGLGLIVIGYGLEIYFYHFADMLRCTGVDCASAIDLLLAR